ncbi:MAG TPA: DUF2231 domain-containing protein [Allosphingosinicella sp.]|nr:DUF2231 domain-containing protein [Allosphingosinicella sp.]
MVLKRIAALLTLWVVASGLSVSPAGAHKKERHQQPPPAAAQQAGSPGAAPASAAPMAGHDMGGMMDDMAKDRSKMSTFERFLDWLGRLHPVIIHFPIAFFPAALFTAAVGRRRPAFSKPVQFLVVTGGLIAPVAAVLGWLDAIGADPDPLLTVHRWLGTAVGIAGLALAIWAWKRPEEDRGPGMVWALAAITAAIVVQGWFGGALVHGIDHMNW